MCERVESNSMHFHLIKEPMKRLIARERTHFFNLYAVQLNAGCDVLWFTIQHMPCIIRLILVDFFSRRLKIKSLNKLWMNLKWFAAFDWRSEWKIAHDSSDWCTTLRPFIDKCQSTLMFAKKQRSFQQPKQLFLGFSLTHFGLLTERNDAQNRRMLII